MDILDNATIVRNLSDPTLWGSVLSEVKGLIKMVEYMEEINDIEHKLHTSTKTLAYDNFIYGLESLSRQWSESLKLLHLGDLDWWVINDSVDIKQLEFRLKQIKCRLGGNWDKEEANRLHTDLLNITDRLADVILNLEDNAYMCMYDLEAMIADTKHGAWYTIKFLCKWLGDIISLQDYMQKIIEGAESMLNPQPTQTETEPQKAITGLNSLFCYEGVKVAFDLAERQGFMTREGNYYKWLDKNALLSYFCEKLFCILFPQMTGNKYWGYFSNVFLCKGVKGKWVVPDADKLLRYKTDYLKYKDKFYPDKSREIDLIITEAKETIR